MLKTLAVRRSVNHVSGRRDIQYGPTEFIVCVLARNGSAYLPSFLEHYRKLGAKHFVFLDNASDDDFPMLAAREADTTVLSTALPYKKYKFALKQYLARRYAFDRWVLLVDIDELFDFPYSGEVAMPELLGYLNRGRYTAVTAQMLDMFAAGALGAVNHRWPPDLRREFPYYDLGNIRQDPAQIGRSRVSNPDITALFGGIRSTTFRVDPMLTKYPLLKIGAGLRPVPGSAHRVHGARIADFSAVLMHYKFLDDFEATTREIVEKGSYYNGSEEYKAYQEILAERGAPRLFSDNARRLERSTQLVDEGFLKIGDGFARFVDELRMARV